MIAVFVVGVCGIYLNDYYHADTSSIEVLTYDTKIEELTLDDNMLVFSSDTPQVGLIFYPGGKVEYTAYTPLMKSLAQHNVLCILVEMPFNLAVLDINAADGLPSQYPEIESWYIGGHSLGGSMAASYLENNIDQFDGLILLGSYSTVDFSKTSLDVLSIYGSEDRVLNRGKYEENKINLPSEFTETIIDGGCHAFFGMYGSQEGDGTPSITNEQQIQITTDEIIQFINKGVE